MKKMLLMSTGIGCLEKLIDKNQTVGVIPTAQDLNTKDFRNNGTYLYLQERFSTEYIDITSQTKEETIKLLNKVDVLYVAGGCTYTLLKALQEKNLLLDLKRRVNEGMFYIGKSAGGVLLCDDISYDYPLEEIAQNHNLKLESTKGLGLFPIPAIFHADEPDEAYQAGVQEILAKEEQVLLINEEIAILVEEQNGRMNITPIESKYL